MQYEVIMNACFAEDGAMCTIVIQGSSGMPLYMKEIADALRDYADILEDRDELKSDGN